MSLYLPVPLLWQMNLSAFTLVNSGTSALSFLPVGSILLLGWQVTTLAAILVSIEMSLNKALWGKEGWETSQGEEMSIS